jgi:hypothetical protein
MRTVTGGSFPARIFTSFMRGALEGVPAKQFGALPANAPNGATPTGTPIYTGIDPALVGQQVTVPSLIIPLADARAVAAANGVVLVESYAANVDQNATLYVINQSVPAGTVVMAGTVVGVTISNTAASP